MYDLVVWADHSFWVSLLVWSYYHHRYYVDNGLKLVSTPPPSSIIFNVLNKKAPFLSLFARKIVTFNFYFLNICLCFFLIHLLSISWVQVFFCSFCNWRIDNVKIKATTGNRTLNFNYNILEDATIMKHYSGRCKYDLENRTPVVGITGKLTNSLD